MRFTHDIDICLIDRAHSSNFHWKLLDGKA